MVGVSKSMSMKKEKRIIPAIIAKSQDELDNRLSKVLDYVDFIQLDIMDNKFVPNTSLFFDFKLPETSCKFEAHLMVETPQEWVTDYMEKVDTVLVHYESHVQLEDVISIVKDAGKKIGVVLNPETSVDKISKYLDCLDQVLVMTVNPGFYGSPFLPETLEKITQLRKLKPELDIEVDGGITDATISLVDAAGANMFVSGSYIIKAEDVKGAIKNLERIVRVI